MPTSVQTRAHLCFFLCFQITSKSSFFGLALEMLFCDFRCAVSLSIEGRTICEHSSLFYPVGHSHWDDRQDIEIMADHVRQAQILS